MQISILGCGWLGLPLAKAFINNSIAVKGSTTTQEKITLLKEAGIIPFLIDLTNYEPATGNNFLMGSDVLIINIPPKLRQGGSDNYPDKVRSILPQVEAAGISKVLFVSSTSVYADNNGLVGELTQPDPDSDSGKQILQAEQLLQDNLHFKTTILRFGGLIGKDRHPARFLAGRQNIANPDAPVNLIHQEDCIGIILKIIEEEAWGEIFNAASPQHPTRQDYYTGQASALGLQLPHFDHTVPSVGKTILSEKIKQVLGYSFTHII